MSVDKTVFQPKSEGSIRQGVRLNGIFEIERLIAEGGMGEVYKGVAVASGDPVAIKLVRPEMSRDPEVMALFKREAQILHDLLHDAIVRYYVFSLEPELQRYYIAMEFVDGVSLQKRLADGPLSPAEARILLKRIGGALEQAHSRGVIHRDISSDNIILPGGDVRKAKIVDFGIARAARAGEGTIIGAGFAGKYKYVSPEQLGLMGGEVTPKSDMYSFGLVIAEALRGQPIDMGGTQVEVIEKRRTVPDLSGIDLSLRPLLIAMLAPDPQDRPDSMAEIAAWGDGATVLQAAATLPPPAAAPKRSRVGGLVAAAVAIVVVAGAGAAVYLLRDNLGLGGQTTVVSKPGETPAFTPPALGPKETPKPTATQTATGSTPTATPSPTKTEAIAEGPKVTADALLEQMPPKAASSVVTLAPATVGTAYRAELPAFSDPAGKGLVMHAAPAPPAGLSFKSLGGGRSEIAGAPTAAGDAVFDVVAVTQTGKSGHMKVALTVNARPQPSPSPQPLPSRPAPPQPAQGVVDLEPAKAGSAYSAGLPPFRSQEAVALRAGPGLPAGLTLNDLGNGLSQLAGEPKTPGKYAFDVVARTAAGAEGRMKVRIEVARAAAPPVAPPPSPVAETPVAPPPPSAAATPVVASPTPAAATPTPPPLPPLPPVAETPVAPPPTSAAVTPVAPTTPVAETPVAPPPSPQPTETPVVATPAPAPTPTSVASPTPPPGTVVAKVETAGTSAVAFLRDYPPVHCFAARLKDDDPAGHTITTVGADAADFERFGAAFKNAVRVEPDMRGFVVRPSQCPAVDFLEATSSTAKGMPRIVLDSAKVGNNRPLSGTILGLAGRPLLLLVVDDDGNVFRLRAQSSPGGDSATFSASFTGDPSSIGKPQMVIAVASDQPIGGGVTIDGASSATLMPKLAEQGRGAEAGAGFALFKFAD